MAADTAATRTLNKHLEKGSTGRVSVGDGRQRVSVHVQLGQVLAAESAEDWRLYLRRARAESALTSERIAQLRVIAEKGESIFGFLLDEVDPGVLDTMLIDRFRDNLARYLSSTELPVFEFTAGVFVDNLQVVDSASTLKACLGLADRASRVRADAELRRGTREATRPIERALIAALERSGWVTDLLEALPIEPLAGRAMLADYLDDGLVGRAPLADIGEVDDETESFDQYQMVPPEMPPTTTDVEPATEDEPSVEDEGVVQWVSRDPGASPRARKPAPGVEIDAPDPVTEGPIILAMEDLEPIADAPEWVPTADAPATPPVDLPPTPDPSGDVVPEDFSDPISGDPTPTISPMVGQPIEDPFDMTSGDDTPVPGEDGGTGDLSSLSAWMSHGVQIDDDLAVFADNDEIRGASGQGKFSTEQHNLDRVEVAEVSDDASSADEPIEAEELPQARFGAPTITDDEAAAKIEVANDVLEVVSGTFDAEHGSGAGKAAFQILLDGSPNRFAPLFKGVQSTENGHLPVRQLIRNLHTRPVSEHRGMIHDGLVDLIERSLSIAADELSDDAIDTMLEKAAGYRQRMGL